MYYNNIRHFKRYHPIYDALMPASHSVCARAAARWLVHLHVDVRTSLIMNAPWSQHDGPRLA
jgi:hypothetical protein